jgi:hypothetical protein
MSFCPEGRGGVAVRITEGPLSQDGRIRLAASRMMQSFFIMLRYEDIF